MKTVNAWFDRPEEIAHVYAVADVPDACEHKAFELTYDEAIDKRLGVMDLTAFEICKARKVPTIRVFNMKNLDNVIAVAGGQALGTVLHP